MNVAITGANSAVGQAILRWIASHADPPITCVAAVRSERAADEIRDLVGERNSLLRIAYDDPPSLDAAFQDASAVIHLAGILVEYPGSTYEQANVESTRAMVDAAKRNGVGKIVFVSAIGASETSPNRYWLTKGRAEALVRNSGLSYTVIRPPLLLGPGTEGSAALKRNASRQKVSLIGGGRNMQQPLHVDDLAHAAILASQPLVANNMTLELVGPTALLDREIVERAARLMGHEVRIRYVPKALTALGISMRERLGRGGLSLDALDVITAHTAIDPLPAATALGIRLTDIDEMIGSSLGAI
jgi:NADH dehydrogenase